MKLLNTLKRYWFVITTSLLIGCLVPLHSENLSKVLVLSIVIILWCLLGIVLKKFTLSSFLILLLILPFNITYQLPYSIGNLVLANPYVDGIFVNYLVPTLSVLDLGVFLLLVSMLFEGYIHLKWKGFTVIKVFLLFALFLIIQNIFGGDFLTLFNSVRLLVFVFTFYQLSLNLKKLLDKRVFVYVLVLSIGLVVFQGLLALIQFSGGSSLGLSFLGESKVVSGMRGSSFIALNNQLYLRGYGTFPHPNVFGGWLMFNMFLGWFLYDGMDRKRDYSIILMVLSSLVMVLTFSRVGYLVTGLIWLVFLVNMFVRINKKHTKKEKTKEFGMVGLVSERVMNLVGGEDSSWSERLDLMRESIQVIKSNLLLGTGLGRFISSMEGVPRSSSGILILQPVHNVFLLLISELGLIGFGLFSTLLYFFFKSKKFTVRFVTVLVCLVIWGMFDHYWVSLGQGVVVLFLLIIL